MDDLEYTNKYNNLMGLDYQARVIFRTVIVSLNQMLRISKKILEASIIYGRKCRTVTFYSLHS